MSTSIKFCVFLIASFAFCNLPGACCARKNCNNRGKASLYNKHCSNEDCKDVQVTSVNVVEEDNAGTVVVSWEPASACSYSVEVQHPRNDTMDQKTETTGSSTTFTGLSSCTNYTISVTVILEDDSLGQNMTTNFATAPNYGIFEQARFVIFNETLTDGNPDNHCKSEGLTTFSPSCLEEVMLLSKVGRELMPAFPDNIYAHVSGLQYVNGNWTWTLTGLPQTSVQGEDGWAAGFPDISQYPQYRCGIIHKTGYLHISCDFDLWQLCLKL